MCALSPYRIENFSIEGFDVVVNKPKVAAYRAPGAPMAAFAVESLVDELARELEIDPIDLRIHNAVEEGDVAPYGPAFKAIGLKETLEAARAQRGQGVVAESSVHGPGRCFDETRPSLFFVRVGNAENEERFEDQSFVVEVRRPLGAEA